MMKKSFWVFLFTLVFSLGHAAERQVATRSYIPTNLGGGGAQKCMARSTHVMRDDVADVKLVYAGWASLTPFTFPTGQGERDVGATLQIRASVEYPEGIFTPVKWGGSGQGSLESGANYVSDQAHVSIPKNARFWIRTWMSIPGAYQTPYSGMMGLYNHIVDTSHGEALTCGVSQADLTLGGVVPDGFSGQVNIYPAAIIAETSNPAFLILGDSIALGIGGDARINLDTGSIAPAVGRKFGYINASAGGDTAHNAAMSHSKRLQLASFSSAVVLGLGVNDIFNDNASSASIISYMETLWASFSPVASVYQTTITPQTASSDEWRSIGNQTPKPNYATRNPLNNFIMGVPPGIQDFVDVAAGFEAWVTSNKVKFLLTGNALTSDGVHPNAAGYDEIRKVLQSQFN